VPIDGIPSDDQCELDESKLRYQLLAPSFRAQRGWGKVSRLSCARVTESHRYNCDSSGIVKGRAIDAHPFSQAVTALVIEGDSRVVHQATRSLPDDENACRFFAPNHRPRFVIKCAKPTRSNANEQLFELFFSRASHSFN
jgi:hypothetical protein